MVVSELTAEQADRVFHALADRTRRDIVRRVLVGELSVSALGRHYPISLTAVQKHVAVLETAGLIGRTRRGRETIVRADIDTVHRARELLDQYEALWRGRLDRMAEILAGTDPAQPEPAQPDSAQPDSAQPDPAHNPERAPR
jgi:DNA-binding transcriptional ArsR family regulator